MTRDDLAGLLKAKDEAARAFSEAAQNCRNAASEGSTIEQRVVLDIRQKEALKVACAADNAYDAALTQFMGEQT